MKLRKNKKGSLQDIILVAVFILVFGFLALIAFKVTGEMNNNFQSSDIFDARGKAASQSITDAFPGVVDNSFLFFAIGISLVVLALAVFVRIHPIFIPFYIIGWIVVIFISGVMSNIYQSAAANSQLSTEASQLVFISNILEYLPLLVGVVGILLMVVMYKLWKADQFG